MTSESLVMTSGSLVMTSDLHVISLVTFMTCHFTCQVPLDRVVFPPSPPPPPSLFPSLFPPSYLSQHSPPWPRGPSIHNNTPNALCTGCDGKLDSNVHYDTCGVCGGADKCKLGPTLNTNTIVVNFIFGVDAGKSHVRDETNVVAYDYAFRPSSPACQTHILKVCSDVQALAASRLQETSPSDCLFNNFDSSIANISSFTGLPVPEDSFLNLFARFLLDGKNLLKYSGQVGWNGASADHVKFVSLRFRTKMSTQAAGYKIWEEFKFWEGLADQINKNIEGTPAENQCSVFQTAHEFPIAQVQISAINGLVYSIVISVWVFFPLFPLFLLFFKTPRNGCQKGKKQNS